MMGYRSNTSVFGVQPGETDQVTFSQTKGSSDDLNELIKQVTITDDDSLSSTANSQHW